MPGCLSVGPSVRRSVCLSTVFFSPSMPYALLSVYLSLSLSLYVQCLSMHTVCLNYLSVSLSRYSLSTLLPSVCPHLT